MPDEGFAQVYPIVLAAGRSARMGFPKPLADFDGRKAIALVLEACSSAVIGRPVIVLGHDEAKIRPLLPADGVMVVVNEHYSLGMTSSLQVGLAALPADARAFILFPADFALVTGTDLRALAQAFLGRSSEAKRIFMPVYRGRKGHPVLVDMAIAEEFRTLPEEEPARARIYADLNRVTHVEVSNRGVLMDMDTPKDLFECQKEFRRQRGYTTRAVLRPHAPKDPAPPPAPAE